VPTHPPFEYRSSFTTVNRPGSEVNHSHPYSAEVKNGWSYSSIPPIHLQGVHSEKFTFNETGGM
jgi:hypothetical protein